jgi:hypothetical protein
MATEKKQGYDLKVLLEIFNISSIKPRQAGSFKNDEGEEVEYGHAVKFKTIKVEEVPDEDWGTKEVESVLEIEVPCDTMTEAVAVNNHLKAMKASDKSFNIDITMPRQSGTNYTAKTIIKGLDFKNAYKL